MFDSRRTNNKINKLYERALRIVYQDDISNFEEILLEQDNSFPIHPQNIQTLGTEYKKFTTVCLRIVFIFIKIQEAPYNLRSQPDLDIPSVSTESYGKNSLKYFSPMIWNSTPARLRNMKTLTVFENEIHSGKSISVPVDSAKIAVKPV